MNRAAICLAVLLGGCNGPLYETTSDSTTSNAATAATGTTVGATATGSTTSGGTTFGGTNEGSTLGGTTGGSTIGTSTGGSTISGTTSNGNNSTSTSGTSGSSGSVCFGGSTNGGGAGAFPCTRSFETCDGQSIYEVDCNEGNCQCAINGQQVGTCQTPDPNCGANAWAACGFPKNEWLGSPSALQPLPDAGLGGTASVTGPLPFTSTANGYRFTQDGIYLSLANNGYCEGYEATGPWMLLQFAPSGLLAPGSYLATSDVSLNDWDVDAGLYGELGFASSGTITLTDVDAGLLSGTINVTLTLVDGGSSSLEGSFASVPPCAY